MNASASMRARANRGKKGSSWIHYVWKPGNELGNTTRIKKKTNSRGEPMKCYDPQRRKNQQMLSVSHGRKSGGLADDKDAEQQ